MKTAGRKPTNATRLSAASRAFWSGKREQILLDNKRGWKSTKIRPKVKCFLLTSPLIERSRKQASIRGLNQNHNHDLKNLFKSASAVAAAKAGPFQKFYDAQIGKGLKPEMARLTLARKIAAIILIVWKKGVSFDARYLNPQTA